MFGNADRDEKIDKLTREVDLLTKKVATLQQDCQPFMVGEIHYRGYGLFDYPYEDSRPRVSLHQAAQKLMDHCGLRFEKTPFTGGEIVVKDKKDDPMFLQSGAGTVRTFKDALTKPKRRPRK